ncbi:MAG: endonuclease/exonuclease/phosphatase family protein [Microthrixaceae bacterium]
MAPGVPARRPLETLRIATWNVEWATAGTRRGERVAARLNSVVDVMAVTECTLGVLPTGHVVDAGSDWGYRFDDPTRRKVALWSRWPWTDVDPVGHQDLPSGRFIAATTSTPIGDVRVVGVCIPWAGAHVSTGRQDRHQWQDHERYLRALPDILASQTRPLVVAGDFNQRLPRSRQPETVHRLLVDALAGLTIATSGETPAGRLIDHIAISPELRATGRKLIPASDAMGPLSDHTGVTVGLQPVARHAD